jgi:hypothetical protein
MKFLIGILEQLRQENWNKILDKNGLKGFMTNQIYPAFLGTIIFLIFQQVLTQILIIKEGLFSGNIPHVNGLLLYKFILVLSTLIFYYADYYYIQFTNNYRKLFFFFDLIFCVLMLASVVFLNFDNNKIPNVYAILLCYLIFMVLYLWWDTSEMNRTEDKKEKEYYKNRVIQFEKFSIACLVLSSGIYFLSGTYFCLLVLPVITVLFLGISIEKKVYFRDR